MKLGIYTEDIRRMFAGGKPVKDIASVFGCEPSNIVYHLNKDKNNEDGNDIELISWIKKNCFSRSGSLNNRICLDSWWINRGFSQRKKDIETETSWLNTENLTQQIWHILNQINEKPLCKTCGGTVEFRQYKNGYREYCSIQCVTQSEERNRKIGGNRKAAIDNSLSTNKERYGEDFYKRGGLIQNKMQQAKLEKYGCLNVNSDKAKETCLKKYGYEYYYQTDDFKEKSKKTNLEKYGVENLLKLHTSQVKFDDIVFLNRVEKKSCGEIADFYNVSPSFIQQMFHKFDQTPQRHIVSSLERTIHFWLDTLNVKYEKSNRNVLNGKELDIYFPEHKLAVELNGIYWHSFCKNELQNEKRKHLDKLNRCRTKDVRLVQFTDKEWCEKEEICKSIIKNFLNIPERRIRASKCEFYSLSEIEYRRFLETNHIQGYAGCSEKLALKYDNEIVSVMSIGVSRFNKNSSYELIRFCNKLNYKIYGAASKLFGSIKKNNMVSYSSNDYFSGDLYKKLGFVFSHETEPGYFYIKGTKIYNRYQCQKHKLSKFLEKFDASLSEADNMFNNGYRRYWNCGNSVWIFKE